jgi:multidrug efflux pump subunit AcrA (membrane-fusion protein)
VEVPNQDSRLKPGVFAKVELAGSTEVSVLLIPLKAVAGSEGSYYVFTEENGVARRNDVELGSTYNDFIEVKSGLAAGAAVICSNINSLQDGDPVAAITEQGE